MWLSTQGKTYPHDFRMEWVLVRFSLGKVILTYSSVGTRGGFRFAPVCEGWDSSLRRKAQILSARPDVEVVVLRGSVETRLRKLSQGLVDGTLLAKAGIERLHLDHERVAESYEFMSVERYLPAVAQGAIVMEVRSPDKIIDFLAPIHHHHTGKVLTAERAFLDVLDGSCRTPIGGYGEISGNTLKLTGQILSVDGRNSLKTP